MLPRRQPHRCGRRCCRGSSRGQPPAPRWCASWRASSPRCPSPPAPSSTRSSGTRPTAKGPTRTKLRISNSRGQVGLGRIHTNMLCSSSSSKWSRGGRCRSRSGRDRWTKSTCCGCSSTTERSCGMFSRRRSRTLRSCIHTSHPCIIRSNSNICTSSSRNNSSSSHPYISRSSISSSSSSSRRCDIRGISSRVPCPGQRCRLSWVCVSSCPFQLATALHSRMRRRRLPREATTAWPAAAWWLDPGSRRMKTTGALRCISETWRGCCAMQPLRASRERPGLLSTNVLRVPHTVPLREARCRVPCLHCTAKGTSEGIS
mmetsp:Transcript_11092/g.33252  ORF Transcript_11092/g.33252 Transcript_11092/m.33252 type:complete len:316 (+) Transcript_11092:334-1281(+)